MFYSYHIFPSPTPPRACLGPHPINSCSFSLKKMNETKDLYMIIDNINHLVFEDNSKNICVRKEIIS